MTQAHVFGYVKPYTALENPKIHPPHIGECMGVVKALVFDGFLANSENLCYSYDERDGGY